MHQYDVQGFSIRRTERSTLRGGVAVLPDGSIEGVVSRAGVERNVAGLAVHHDGGAALLLWERGGELYVLDKRTSGLEGRYFGAWASALPPGPHLESSQLSYEGLVGVYRQLPGELRRKQRAVLRLRTRQPH